MNKERPRMEEQAEVVKSGSSDLATKARVDKMAEAFSQMQRDFQTLITKSNNELMVAKRDIEDLKAKICDLSNLAGTFVKVESEQQDELRAALAQTVLDCEAPQKTGTNQYQKPSYTLDDFQRASKAACKKNGIGITFDEKYDGDGDDVLITTITHVPSKQYRSFTSKVKQFEGKNSVHSKQSSYTIAKKMCLGSLLNLGGDEE